MLQTLLDARQAIGRRICVLSLTLLLGMISLLVFFESPSYAVTTAKDKLSQDEKIDRAYQFREGTGVLEEDKQASDNRDAIFKPEDKAKEKSVKTSGAPGTAPNLKERAQELLKR